MSEASDTDDKLLAALETARGKTLQDFKLDEGAVTLIFGDGTALWVGSMGCRDEPVIIGGAGRADDLV